MGGLLGIELSNDKMSELSGVLFHPLLNQPGYDG